MHLVELLKQQTDEQLFSFFFSRAVIRLHPLQYTKTCLGLVTRPYRVVYLGVVVSLSGGSTGGGWDTTVLS